MKKFILVFILSFIFSLTTYIIIKKEDGITKNTITLGQSCALSGTSENLGQCMKNGALAYFNYINDNGGINGKKIKLITYDDKYEPKLAIENTKRLIKDDKVFALFGEVGTQTSIEVLPIIKKYRVPFLMPMSGANDLREPFVKNVIHYRSSYYEETQKLLDYLINNLHHEKIAIFYQNDLYGKSVLDSTKKILKTKNIELISKATYKRNTLSITNALNKIVKTNPQSIIMIGSYKANAEFIKRAKKMGLNETIFANISFVSAKSLIKALDFDGKNVIISQVVPNPFDISNPAIKEYQEIFAKYFPDKEFGYISLESFLGAKIIVEALKKDNFKITRNSFISNLETLEKDSIKGLDLKLSKVNHQASDVVNITKYENNTFKVIDESIR